MGDVFTACKAKGKLKLEAVGGRWRLHAQHQQLTLELFSSSGGTGNRHGAMGWWQISSHTQHTTPRALRGRGKTGRPRPQGVDLDRRRASATRICPGFILWSQSDFTARFLRFRHIGNNVKKFHLPQTHFIP